MDPPRSQMHQTFSIFYPQEGPAAKWQNNKMIHSRRFCVSLWSRGLWQLSRLQAMMQCHCITVLGFWTARATPQHTALIKLYRLLSVSHTSTSMKLR